MDTPAFDDDEDGHGWARWAALVVAALATVAAVAVLTAPVLAAQLRGEDDGSVGGAPATTVAGTTGTAGTAGTADTAAAAPVDTAAEAPTPRSAPAATTPTSGTAATSTASTAVAATAPAATALQTVPPMRDVVLDIGGRRVTTDASGAVALTPDDAGAAITVIGTIAVPQLRTVTFGRWGDGSLDAARVAGSLPGPVAELGLVVRTRVLVTTPQPVAAGTTATFSTPLGVVDLPVGEPTWVVATVAADASDGLVPTDVEYALRALSDGTPVPAQYFRATPEATWAITE